MKYCYPYSLFADIKTLDQELADYLSLYHITIPQWRLDYYCKLLTEKYENKDGSFDYFPFLYRLPGLIQNNEFTKQEIDIIRNKPIKKEKVPFIKQKEIHKILVEKKKTKSSYKKSYNKKVVKEGKVRYIYPTSNRDYYSEKITKLINTKDMTRSEAIQYLDNIQLRREYKIKREEQNNKEKQKLQERLLIAFNRLNDRAMDKRVKLVHIDNLSVTYFDKVIDAANFLDISSQAIFNAFRKKNILNKTYIVRLK